MEHAVKRLDSMDYKSGITVSYCFNWITGRGGTRRAAVVEAAEGVRDALDLPSRLGDVDCLEPSEFPDVAEAILDDSSTANAPPDLAPTREEIVAVLRRCGEGGRPSAP